MLSCEYWLRPPPPRHTNTPHQKSHFFLQLASVKANNSPHFLKRYTNEWNPTWSFNHMKYALQLRGHRENKSLHYFGHHKVKCLNHVYFISRRSSFSFHFCASTSTCTVLCTDWAYFTPHPLTSLLISAHAVSHQPLNCQVKMGFFSQRCAFYFAFLFWLLHLHLDPWVPILELYTNIININIKT